MKKKERDIIFAAFFLALFVLWTAAVCLIDVKPIGPLGSSVGFSCLNGFVHSLIGVHMELYTITDILSIVPLGFAGGFGILGLIRWIKRGKISKVDSSILVLGIFYAAIIVTFIFFEFFPVNYRPVLIEGILEPSYPSSTTLLVMCVISSAAMQLDSRIKNVFFRRSINFLLYAFTAFMVFSRLFSGVHWISDIIGGVLLSFGLILLYRFFCRHFS